MQIHIETARIMSCDAESDSTTGLVMKYKKIFQPLINPIKAAASKTIPGVLSGGVAALPAERTGHQSCQRRRMCNKDVRLQADIAKPAGRMPSEIPVAPCSTRVRRIVLNALSLFLVCSSPAWAEELSQQFRKCAAVADDKERLVCYDRLASSEAEAVPEQSGPGGVASLPVEQKSVARESGDFGALTTSDLSRHWEVDASDKRGIFHFRPHQDNYFIGTYNPSPNADPYLPFRGVAPNAGRLSDSELAFQLGFKFKLLQEPMGTPMDIWFGYTQRSFWQAQNTKASSPFRESNYQPELMAVIPLDVNLLALKMRFLNLGISHQSNGQVSSLSRSWNRVYAQLGFEHENFSMLTRVWKRINEDNDTDDNPRIVDYMGHGDVLGTYRWSGHELSLLARYNFSTDKGAAQLGWAFPLVSNLKGYVQYFNGYGYSLIDYDAHQKVFGFGILVDF
ncbi:phospholipase A [Oxalobacteraceae bacterium R-40]|uniref:Phospholipase A1 n=1 Tax=Keguizhuia sedimenti TaxID=3064264 RepID=A0ABU1BLA9_9BURK|nr:phospholipase A [Oxalobacteraceae bacterium R-40]